MVQQGPEEAAAAPTTPVTVMHRSTAPPPVLGEGQDSPSRVRLVGLPQSAIAQRPRSSSILRPYTSFCHAQKVKGRFSIGKQADGNGIRPTVAPWRSFVSDTSMLRPASGHSGSAGRSSVLESGPGSGSARVVSQAKWSSQRDTVTLQV